MKPKRSVFVGAIINTGATVAWLSRIRLCVRLSWIGAEHVATSERADEGHYLGQVLEFIRPEWGDEPVKMYGDNEWGTLIVTPSLVE